MSEIKFHYAFQLCDTQSNQNLKRICGDDRTLLSKKSLKSFITTILDCIENLPESEHTVMILNDRSTDDLIQFVNHCITTYSSDKLKFKLKELSEPGIANSIRECYMYLQGHGRDLVYQVQDDYIFTTSALYEMYQVYIQMKNEINYDIIVSPFNDFYLWLAVYRNSCTPRTVIVGQNRYWIQYYDMSCSFMTSHTQFSKHWDLYHMFFDLIEKNSKLLENHSLNYMLTQRGVLGLVPINSLAFHMQSELEKDPHIPWEPIWDNLDVTIPSA